MMKSILATTSLLLIALTCLAQTQYEPTETIEGIRVIASVAHPNHYLSLDNGEFFGSTYGDQGKVEVTQEIGSHEVFEIKQVSEGIYAIASTDVKERYLQVDGSQVKPESKEPGGRVVIQVFVGRYERFKIEPQKDGSFTIESINFPGRYLHMSQDKVQVSSKVGKEERFWLLEKKFKTGIAPR
ncbi:MAG: hypothetical protein AAF587_29310 [Bacteroidota bacterium]